jgi:hypothetical protein
MDKQPKTVVDLRKERNARLTPRDPRRAAEYEQACNEVVKSAKQRIADGGDPLENGFLIALASGTQDDLNRSCKLLEQRERSGIRVVRSSTSD